LGILTPDQLVAILTAVTALVTALGGLAVQLRSLRATIERNHDLLNGRVGELLTATQMAALREGELRGRDFKQGIDGGQSSGA